LATTSPPSEAATVLRSRLPGTRGSARAAMPPSTSFPRSLPRRGPWHHQCRCTDICHLLAAWPGTWSWCRKPCGSVHSPLDHDPIIQSSGGGPTNPITAAIYRPWTGYHGVDKVFDKMLCRHRCGDTCIQTGCDSEY
jgi:hypothetical protein